MDLPYLAIKTIILFLVLIFSSTNISFVSKYFYYSAIFFAV